MNAKNRSPPFCKDTLDDPWYVATIRRYRVAVKKLLYTNEHIGKTSRENHPGSLRNLIAIFLFAISIKPSSFMRFSSRNSDGR